MEGKVAKIGLIILIAMVAARFIMSSDQKVDFSSLFERGDSENIVNRIFNGTSESELIAAGVQFSVDYSSIKKRIRTNPVDLNQSNPNTDLAVNNEPIPSDYSSNDDFEMFTYLNSDEVPEPEAEPLDSYSTINATMDLFFPRR